MISGDHGERTLLRARTHLLSTVQAQTVVLSLYSLHDMLLMLAGCAHFPPFCLYKCAHSAQVMRAHCVPRHARIIGARMCMLVTLCAHSTEDFTAWDFILPHDMITKLLTYVVPLYYNVVCSQTCVWCDYSWFHKKCSMSVK